uniref:ATP synthase complex subunit 8 n=1 Tax=Scolytus seulensis TaxID=1230772 RepID=A0A6G6C8Z6_9CUCU|nr:ATP synthase F0 subunit 8 [Scolytus seulensis]QID77569.1 ATP synthase F0 subunit 8 [Scolytus seulensis]
MPQMAPISWLETFIMFTVIFMSITMINYYLFKPMPKTNIKNLKDTALPSWKW